MQEKNNNFDIDYLDDGEGETESVAYSLSGASWIEGFFLTTDMDSRAYVYTPPCLNNVNGHKSISENRVPLSGTGDNPFLNFNGLKRTIIHGD